MIINRHRLLHIALIKNMLETKEKLNGYSHGLSEAGYDIRIKQEVRFTEHSPKFVLASAIEEFQMPAHIMGIVHDKSSWARQGLSVFNTVIEPGWKGFLTLELVYHGTKELIIPAGTGIAQVIFHELEVPNLYVGKYQNQEDKPVEAKLV